MNKTAILIMLILTTTLYGCSAYETAPSKQSTMVSLASLNLNEGFDTSVSHTDSMDPSTQSSETLQTIKTLHNNGLISDKGLQALQQLKTQAPYIHDRPTLSKNEFSDYPLMAFNADRPEKQCEHFKTVNRNHEEQEKEVYLFTMYNAMNTSHGHGRERHMVQMPILIHDGDRPVELYLISYEPTAWTLKGAVDRVTKVKMFGYHAQRVDSEGPITDEIYISSYEQGYSNFHRKLQSFNVDHKEDFFTIILRVYLGSDLTKMEDSYHRQCLGEFIASP